jgi:hypothetical protein
MFFVVIVPTYFNDYMHADLPGENSEKQKHTLYIIKITAPAGPTLKSF